MLPAPQVSAVSKSCACLICAIANLTCAPGTIGVLGSQDSMLGAGSGAVEHKHRAAAGDADAAGAGVLAAAETTGEAGEASTTGAGSILTGVLTTGAVLRPRTGATAAAANGE